MMILIYFIEANFCMASSSLHPWFAISSLENQFTVCYNNGQALIHLSKSMRYILRTPESIICLGYTCFSEISIYCQRTRNFKLDSWEYDSV